MFNCGCPYPAFGTWETTNPTPAAVSLPSPGRENVRIAQGETLGQRTTIRPAVP
jgi:hypothetical protein